MPDSRCFPMAKNWRGCLGRPDFGRFAHGFALFRLQHAEVRDGVVDSGGASLFMGPKHPLGTVRREFDANCLIEIP